MNTPVFPEARELQQRLKAVEIDPMDMTVITRTINLLEVVKMIDSYTTIDTTPNLCPPLPGFPFTP